MLQDVMTWGQLAVPESDMSFQFKMTSDGGRVGVQVHVQRACFM